MEEMGNRHHDDMLFAQSSPVGSRSLPIKKRINPPKRSVVEQVGEIMTAVKGADQW